ncbi:MAG: imidazolonepropionase [Candidatus Odinarchaeota archaeon]
MHFDSVILHAAELLTLAGASHKPKLGTELAELGIIKDGAVAIQENRIAAVGKTREIEKLVKAGTRPKVIDATGKTVLPGFVDPHAHLAFAGTREKEFVQKIQGATYMEILEAGGGINVTVKATRRASRKTLVRLGQHTLNRMLRYGTTTIEGKSGYGLEPKHEYKQLLAIRDLNLIHPIDVVPTFMGAHVVPQKYKDRPEHYVKQVMEKMIPTVAKKGMAEFCDVFAEEGVFDIDQSRRILNRAKEYDLIPKVHADEMTTLGGAELAAEVGAISADHLLKVSNQGIQALAKAQVIAVLLPATAFVLMEKEYAPARKLIDAGVPVALATDYNPNCMTESMQLILTLACLNMRMTPAEAIAAATINAAHAINRSHVVGSLEPNKQADILIIDTPNHTHIPYHFGVNLVEKVIKNGKIAFSAQ